MSPAFRSIWYLLGMMFPAALEAVLGPQTASLVTGALISGAAWIALLRVEAFGGAATGANKGTRDFLP
jgi:hypothetical protein